ncbi:ribosomal maturation YjgA family protein [Rhizobium sp. SL42]|uniref:ribosomal maturation YjgA family protein n=1 Tax=Rhizobium sp. SL42 TaxID=2806346 RepID=UPI001F29C096|nr:DUF2809 domain-containing protein [Rhizobium sp. SL42]UJW73437.1 DUF2809 domain-containing protein [Rhizobium sp. SL42]
MDKIKASTTIRWRRLAISAFVIVCGLVLRLAGYEIGLPFLLVKYGGSLLWGMMVFWLLAVLFVGQPLGRVAMIASVIAAATEFSRLYHAPWLDEFRLTLAGALLLGRIFSVWNILAYLIGIAAAALIERQLLTLRQRAE